MNYHYDDSFHPNLKKQPQVPMLENKNLPKQVRGCLSYDAGHVRCNQLTVYINYIKTPLHVTAEYIVA